MIKLSITSKLDGIASWSLEAGVTCPASYAPNGELVDACKGCYAMGGNYRFPRVKKPRQHNKEDWKRKEWVSDMIATLDNHRYFRWFDSGDMYSLKLAEKMLLVMQSTPWVKHWLPTRMYKFKKFHNIIKQMKRLPNVMVRFSSDSVVGHFNNEHGSTIIPTLDSVPAGVSPCLAYQHGGKCSGCRKCWDKSIPVIAYVAQGKSMSKVVKQSLIDLGLID